MLHHFVDACRPLLPEWQIASYRPPISLVTDGPVEFEKSELHQLKYMTSGKSLIILEESVEQSLSQGRKSDRNQRITGLTVLGLGNS
jgi:hypothetical protein